MAELDDKKQNAKGETASAKHAYEITGIAPGVYHFTGFGEIDLTKFPTDEVCEKLVKRKFPYIRRQ